MEWKFTIALGDDGKKLSKTFSNAKEYCEKEYTNGQLPSSDSLDDWKDVDSIKLVLVFNAFLYYFCKFKVSGLTML